MVEARQATSMSPYHEKLAVAHNSDSTMPPVMAPTAAPAGDDAEYGQP